MKRVMQCAAFALLVALCAGFGPAQQSSSVLNSVGLVGSGGSAVINVSFTGQSGTGFALGSADSAQLTITTTAITLPRALAAASLSIPANAFRVRIKVVSGTLVLNTQGSTDGTVGAFGNGFVAAANQPSLTSPDQVGAGQVVTVDNSGTIAYAALPPNVAAFGATLTVQSSDFVTGTDWTASSSTPLPAHICQIWVGITPGSTCSLEVDGGGGTAKVFHNVQTGWLAIPPGINITKIYSPADGSTGAANLMVVN